MISDQMRTTTINFVQDFTRFPGGRLIKYGPNSGEEFRERVLKPALAEYDQVTLDMNGVLGFPASFLDEVFGVLAGQLGREELKRKLKIILDNKVTLTEIEDVIATHTS
jgi:STAS-like domain of unknown function (DUF4325)